MSTSSNQFKKKKPVFDFSDNAMMKSSVKVPNKQISDEKCLEVMKELIKLKKDHKELRQRYDRMKIFNIEERTDLVLNLEQAELKIEHLKEQKEMLLARISYLEKENNSIGKSYQRPLNRSVMKKSTIVHQNLCLNIKSHPNAPKTQRSQTSMTSLDQMLRTKKGRSLNETLLDGLQFTENDHETTIRFDKKSKEMKALINEEDLIDEQPYCGNKRCLEHYIQLQNLRQSSNYLVQKVQGICIGIQQLARKTINEQAQSTHKQSLEILRKQNPGIQYFYKSKPEYLVGRIEQKMKQLMNTQSYKKFNPLMDEIKQKIKKLQKEEEEFREEFDCQSYDSDLEQKQINQIAKNQQIMFDRVKKYLQYTGIKNEKAEKLIEQYESTREEMWRKAGIPLDL